MHDRVALLVQDPERYAIPAMDRGGDARSVRPP